MHIRQLCNPGHVYYMFIICLLYISVTYDKRKFFKKNTFIYIFKNIYFFVAKTKKSGLGVIASYSDGFYIFLYFKIYFILKPYSMGSYLKYNRTLFQVFVIIKII